MKIKETELKNNKIHAFVHINPYYTCYVVVFHGSHDWISSSLHLNNFHQFLIRFKTCLYD